MFLGVCIDSKKGRFGEGYIRVVKENIRRVLTESTKGGPKKAI
jgi:hypothetical protein